MSKSATREYVERTRTRYGKMKTRKARSRILDEFCATTGYERKHAIKRLNGRAGNRKRPPGRKAVYDESVKSVLKAIWMMSDQMCSKRLKAILPLYVRSYEKHHGRLNREIRGKLLRISASSIDRLLRSERVATQKWRRRPNAGRCIKKVVPVRWRYDRKLWMGEEKSVSFQKPKKIPRWHGEKGDAREEGYSRNGAEASRERTGKRFG